MAARGSRKIASLCVAVVVVDEGSREVRIIVEKTTKSMSRTERLEAQVVLQENLGVASSQLLATEGEPALELSRLERAERKKTLR